MSIDLGPSTLQLGLRPASGSFTDCLNNPVVIGVFDNYLFCAATGRHVVLGHRSFGPLLPGQIVGSIESGWRAGINIVFVKA